MSQSKMALTRSGFSGANWQLSSLRSLWTIEARPGAGLPRASRSWMRSMAESAPSGRASDPALCPPVELAIDEAVGAPQVAEPARGGIEGVQLGHRLD